MNIIEKTISISKKAYTPYSNFKVGAGVLFKNDNGDTKEFFGCNIENAAYGSTMCAERTAIFKGITEEFSYIHTVYVFTDTENLTPPCGACLQVIVEFADDKTKVVLFNNHKSKEFLLTELLPNYFSQKNL